MDDDRARAHSGAAERLLETEATQDSRRVRTYLHAGADFAKFGGLFEDLDLEAGARKRQRSGESVADPRANYYDSAYVVSLVFSASASVNGGVRMLRDSLAFDLAYLRARGNLCAGVERSSPDLGIIVI